MVVRKRLRESVLEKKYLRGSILKLPKASSSFGGSAAVLRFQKQRKAKSRVDVQSWSSLL